ncbi:MAG: hypothetical protein HOW59_10750, partial [Nonomuraea sp.]|nr:hypothetical protein [Nonomuraea sp.]
MRTRLPAALLLVLSWLLPAIGHGEAAHQVAAVHETVLQAATAQEAAGPEPHPATQAGPGLHLATQAGPGPLPA